MSLWRPRVRRTRKALALGLDARDLAWVSDGASPPGSVATAGHRDGIAQALAGVGPGMAVDVIAANDVAVHWLQTPPTSVASFSELRLVASARCAYLYGGSPQDWEVGGDWNATQPFPCAALPHMVVAPLKQQLTQLGVRARWHTVWGLLCRARADAFPRDGWSAVRSATRIMLWHCRGGDVDCLTSLPLDAQMTEEQVFERALQQVQVECVRLNGPSQGPLHWLDLTCGELPSLPGGIRQVVMQTPDPASAPHGEAAVALSLRRLLEGTSR